MFGKYLELNSRCKNNNIDNTTRILILYYLDKININKFIAKFDTNFNYNYLINYINININEINTDFIDKLKNINCINFINDEHISIPYPDELGPYFLENLFTRYKILKENDFRDLNLIPDSIYKNNIIFNLKLGIFKLFVSECMEDKKGYIQNTIEVYKEFTNFCQNKSEKYNCIIRPQDYNFKIELSKIIGSSELLSGYNHPFYKDKVLIGKGKLLTELEADIQAKKEEEKRKEEVYKKQMEEQKKQKEQRRKQKEEQKRQNKFIWDPNRNYY